MASRLFGFGDIIYVVGDLHHLIRTKLKSSHNVFSLSQAKALQEKMEHAGGEKLKQQKAAVDKLQKVSCASYMRKRSLLVF